MAHKLTDSAKGVDIQVDWLKTYGADTSLCLDETKACTSVQQA